MREREREKEKGREKREACIASKMSYNFGVN